MNDSNIAPLVLPLLPLRDVVVFPHMVIPLFVGRQRSIKALEAAMESGKSIMLVAQRNGTKDDPSAGDVYDVGCISRILQLLRLPDGTVKVLIEGASRARIARVDTDGEYFACELQDLGTEEPVSAEVEALRRTILGQFEHYVKLNKKVPSEILSSLASIEDPGAWPTPSPPTCPSASTRSRTYSKPCRSPSGWKSCSPRSRTNWTSCRSRSASVAASSARWRRASASTT